MIDWLIVLDLRNQFGVRDLAYAICVRDAIYVRDLRTRRDFCVLDSILRTRFYVRDFSLLRDFAYAICVRDAIFRACANRVRNPFLRTRNAARLAPQNRVRRLFLMPCLIEKLIKFNTFPECTYYNFLGCPFSTQASPSNTVNRATSITFETGAEDKATALETSAEEKGWQFQRSLIQV